MRLFVIHGCPSWNLHYGKFVFYPDPTFPGFLYKMYGDVIAYCYVKSLEYSTWLQFFPASQHDIPSLEPPHAVEDPSILWVPRALSDLGFHGQPLI